MTFLNATLIFGVAAAVVPIALHLIARREPRKVTFPSIRFLTRRLESNRSRLRVRRWWLLLLRIAAVVALAVALARPAIHQALSLTWLTIGLVAATAVALLVMASVALTHGKPRGVTYGLAAAAAVAGLIAGAWGIYTQASGPRPVIDRVGPVAIAIVLDNSATSAWKTPTDDRMARMQDLATWMATRIPRTSRIAILDRSAQPATFSLDVASAVAKIEQLRPLELTQPIGSRIDAAARLVRTSDLNNRQVLVITDLSRATWGDDLNESGLGETLEQDEPVALTVFDLGAFSGVNRSLAIPELADATPPRGVPVALTSVLSVSGDGPQSTLSATAELELYDNDPRLPVIRDGEIVRPPLRSLDRTTATVSPQRPAELLLTIPSLEPGTHHGRIRLLGQDAMPLDDVRFFSLRVLPPSPVLLVSDQEAEGRVIRQSITVSAVSLDEANSEFAVESIRYEDFAAVRLTNFDAIVLLDPPRDVLGDPSLLTYAQQGGGIFVCLGPAAGEDALATNWMPELVRRWRVPDPGTYFQVVDATHPVTQGIARDTPWADFRVRQYWQVKPAPGDTPRIVYAGTDHAALLERIFPGPPGTDSGRLLVLTTPLPALAVATRSWNDLFGIDPWPAWLLTRSAVEFVSGRGAADRMFALGIPQTIRLESSTTDTTASDSGTSDSGTSDSGTSDSGTSDSGTSDSGTSDSGAADTGLSSGSLRLQLFAPEQLAPVPVEVPPGTDQVVISDIARAGTYWLRGDAAGAGFSANLSESAIQIERIDPSALDPIFGDDAYGFATDRDEIQLAESKATQSVSLHSPAMLLALVIFLLEQVLANRFYRARG